MKLLHRFALSFRATAQHFHHWCNFRKAKFFLHKLVTFINDVSTNREGAVSINVLFSLEIGKNKIVAK